MHSSTTLSSFCVAHIIRCVLCKFVLKTLLRLERITILNKFNSLVSPLDLYVPLKYQHWEFSSKYGGLIFVNPNFKKVV